MITCHNCRKEMGDGTVIWATEHGWCCPYCEAPVSPAPPQSGHVPLPDKSHYRHTVIDPCQYVEAMGTAEFRGACVLNILKYLTRYPHKGTPLMDLAKAQDYLTMLIEHEKKKATASTQEEDKRR